MYSCVIPLATRRFSFGVSEKEDKSHVCNEPLYLDRSLCSLCFSHDPDITKKQMAFEKSRMDHDFHLCGK